MPASCCSSGGLNGREGGASPPQGRARAAALHGDPVRRDGVRLGSRGQDRLRRQLVVHADQLNELQAEVQSVGAELLYIPQYCPRANAIEGGFSQVNKELEADIVLADRDPERALDEAFQRVGPRYGAAFARRFTLTESFLRNRARFPGAVSCKFPPPKRVRFPAKSAIFQRNGSSFRRLFPNSAEKRQVSFLKTGQVSEKSC